MGELVLSFDPDDAGASVVRKEENTSPKETARCGGVVPVRMALLEGEALEENRPLDGTAAKERGADRGGKGERDVPSLEDRGRRQTRVVCLQDEEHA